MAKDENIKMVERGIAWFNKTHPNVIQQCHTYFGKNIEKTRAKR